MRDINDAVVFVKVVEQGSFTAAARELRLPKSTVSRKVRSLETRLGAQMLHRTTRRLDLTEAGKVYFERCREISRDLEDAENAVAELQAEPRGWLRIAAAPTVASSWVAPLLGEFYRRFPEIQVEMQLTDERPDMIGNGYDIALYTGELPDSGLAARWLTSFGTRVYASADYIRRYGEPAHAEQLAEHRVLALASHRHGGHYQWTMQNGEESGVYTVRPWLVSNDASLLHAPLLAGEALALACRFSMRDYRATGAVQEIMPGWSGPTLELNAVFPRSRMLPPKVRVFIDFLVERLDALTSAPAPASVQATLRGAAPTLRKAS